MLQYVLYLALLDTATRVYSLMATWEMRSMSGKTHQYSDVEAMSKKMSFTQGCALAICVVTAAVFTVWIYPTLLFEVYPLQIGKSLVTLIMAVIVILGWLDLLQGLFSMIRRLIKKPETVKAPPFWQNFLKQTVFSLQAAYLWYLVLVL